MKTSTLVSVHQVDAAGATGSRVGGGSLIHRQLVLIHSPLSRQLAQGESAMTRLRLAIGSFDGHHPVVEVIDADEILIAETPGDDPVVAVGLPRPASSPREPLAGLTADLTRDRLIEVLSQHMARQPTSHRERSEEEDDSDDPELRPYGLCGIFNWSFCRSIPLKPTPDPDPDCE
ncbi:MAG: hypothetical protein DLM59_03385 [Pseudonocardiales bacterium]|nr:MAG: hypothetical protein DLM59_03385 [Pseudonocardiales bacterium]